MNNLALYTPIDIIHVVMPIFSMTIMGYLVYKLVTYNSPKKKTSWAHKKTKVYGRFKAIKKIKDSKSETLYKMIIEGDFRGKNRLFYSLPFPTKFNEHDLPSTIIVYVDDANPSKYYVDLRSILSKKYW